MTTKFCLLNFISQEPYIIWSWLMVHMCKRICPGAFLHFFQILIFGVNSGIKKQKWPKMSKNCLTSYLRNYTSYDCGFCYTSVKWWYLQQIFSFFQKFDFSGFSKFINKCQMEILRGAPPSSYVCDVFFETLTYFVPIRVIKDRITKIYPKYLNGKLWPYHLPCFINSFLFDPTNKAWFFETFIFELEAFYIFKITCILVRQVISLKKNGGVIHKIYCLILSSPICTALILVSASVWMAVTSATVTYSSMRICTPGELLY